MERFVLYARKKAGFSQRELAERAGVTQATVARIEKSEIDPKLGTVSGLLKACGFELDISPLGGAGVDRTAIRELLKLTPTQRVQLAAEEARNLERALPRRQ